MSKACPFAKTSLEVAANGGPDIWIGDFYIVLKPLMKRFIALMLTLLLVFPLSACEKRTPAFNDVSWGMTLSEVKRAEKGKGAVFNDVYMVSWAYLNAPCTICYSFTDNKLSNIMVNFDEKYGDYEHFKDYFKMLEIKYPDSVAEITDNSSSTTLPMIRVEWNTSDTIVSLIYTPESKHTSEAVFIDFTPTETN